MSKASSLEAKIVVLGSQGVGKTSLVNRFVKNAFTPPTTTSTIGASFLTKRVVDIDTNTVVRLQIWDTAGQERFRSISKLYYRGANAGVLCYDITDPHSFEEMGSWMKELKQNLGDDIILHVVGTKSDVVAEDPSRRKVPFERCIAYVAEHLYPATPAQNGQAAPSTPFVWPGGQSGGGMVSPQSNRSSGFWGQEIGWDCCHEISAKDGEGVDEVFRVITRKLVEQHQKRMEEEFRQLAMVSGVNGDGGAGPNGYFDYPGDGNGSFRLGVGDRRRSWLGFPITPAGVAGEEQAQWEEELERRRKSKGEKCC
ncbi:P-loop containing nucleoside triphosphate hydrolase protein [Westerdykella ornata]|uniref:P-loop containing nucleoside triphosphate hydrolase protein n=1 Tax=Westerdykella ornata TaxID=318751 RepID=A0A6A6JUA0_WESOR|nr:P-loop containing nucleoside triphosphate hydrolase protein [Westerdykella ornata]KAF2280200.1 P-loop containing nucleoside triphosphate hydrolase protein [Westerdykella ornata]